MCMCGTERGQSHTPSPLDDDKSVRRVSLIRFQFRPLQRGEWFAGKVPRKLKEMTI